MSSEALKKFGIAFVVIFLAIFLAGFAIKSSQPAPLQTVTGLTYGEAGYRMNEEFSKISPNASLHEMIILEEDEDGKSHVAAGSPVHIAECISKEMNDQFICPAETIVMFDSDVGVIIDGEERTEIVSVPGLKFDRDGTTADAPILIDVIENEKVVGTWSEFINSKFDRVDDNCDLTQEICEILV